MIIFETREPITNPILASNIIERILLNLTNRSLSDFIFYADIGDRELAIQMTEYLSAKENICFGGLLKEKKGKCGWQLMKKYNLDLHSMERFDDSNDNWFRWEAREIEKDSERNILHNYEINLFISSNAKIWKKKEIFIDEIKKMSFRKDMEIDPLDLEIGDFYLNTETEELNNIMLEDEIVCRILPVKHSIFVWSMSINDFIQGKDLPIIDYLDSWDKLIKPKDKYYKHTLRYALGKNHYYSKGNMANAKLIDIFNALQNFTFRIVNFRCCNIGWKYDKNAEINKSEENEINFWLLPKKTFSMDISCILSPAIEFNEDIKYEIFSLKSKYNKCINEIKELKEIAKCNKENQHIGKIKHKFNNDKLEELKKESMQIGQEIIEAEGKLSGIKLFKKELEKISGIKFRKMTMPL